MNDTFGATMGRHAEVVRRGGFPELVSELLRKSARHQSSEGVSGIESPDFGGALLEGR